MFTLPPEGDDIGWSPQKVSNIHCVLQVNLFINLRRFVICLFLYSFV